MTEQEQMVLEITELACELMEKQGVTTAILAKRIGCDVDFCTLVLDGSVRQSFRLNVWFRIFYALGHRLHFSTKLLGDDTIILCRVCDKVPGTLRMDRGMPCGCYCDQCWDKLVANCRKQPW